MIDFTMTRVLKAYPGAAAVYQAQPTTRPVLLQPVGPEPVADTILALDPPDAGVQTPLAAFAPVQLGSRLVLLIPFMTNTSLQLPAAPETQYTYTPVWRLRSPVSAGNKPRLGHALPDEAPLPQIGSPTRHEVIPAWTSASFTPPASVAYLTPIPPPGSAANSKFLLYYDAMQPIYGPLPYYPTPYTRVELECEGDEFALLVQPTGGARNWNFTPGAADANFAGRYMENPVPPTGYLKQIGVFLLTGERSP